MLALDSKPITYMIPESWCPKKKEKKVYTAILHALPLATGSKHICARKQHGLLTLTGREIINKSEIGPPAKNVAHPWS